MHNWRLWFKHGRKDYLANASFEKESLLLLQRRYRRSWLKRRRRQRNHKLKKEKEGQDQYQRNQKWKKWRYWQFRARAAWDARLYYSSMAVVINFDVVDWRLPHYATIPITSPLTLPLTCFKSRWLALWVWMNAMPAITSRKIFITEENSNW